MTSRRARSWILSVVLVVSACAPDGDTGVLDEVLASDEDQFAEDLGRVQEHVQDCMGEGGFEYVPYVRSGQNPGAQTLRAAVLAGVDDELVSEFGYGVTRVHQFLEDRRTADPNVAIRESLEEADRQAYSEAFRRCILEGQEMVGLNELGEVSSDLFGLVEVLDAKILADDRVVEITPDWANCLSELGYQYANLADPLNNVQQTAQELFDARAEGLHTHGEETHTHEEGQADHAHGGVDDTDDDAVADLQSFEIEVASADVDCRRQTSMDDVLEEVREELEAVFVSENDDLIQTYRDLASIDSEE